MSVSPKNTRPAGAACEADKPFIVTIDGPAGVGKSTLARRVAETLGVAYLDTGAMFRTVALRLASKGALGAGPEFDPALVGGALLDATLADCSFSLEGAGESTRLSCDGKTVGDEIRSEEAGMMAALAAQIPQVRERLKLIQQRLGEEYSLVSEGRDMGTVVFPQAQCKLFLDADPGVRAERRFLQLRRMGLQADLEELVKQIQDRDYQDRNRPIAPLVPAHNAHCIDTSRLDIEEVFVLLMEHVRASYGKVFCLPPQCPIRRKDRATDTVEAMKLLEKGEYGLLALNDPSGWPYAVPLSYVLMGEVLYFHSACDGRKIRAIKACDRACFVVVSDTQPVYEKGFSTYYESVMVFGRVTPVEDEGDKRGSLMALAEKYLPEQMDKAEGDITRSYSRTAVYKITIERISGKAKRPRP